MGMFDSVNFTCPHCNNSIKVQSKAGVCVLRYFKPGEVPAEIAKDIEGETAVCSDGCGRVWTVVRKVRNDVVPMGLA